jgi:hypothetical protein
MSDRARRWTAVSAGMLAVVSMSSSLGTRIAAAAPVVSPGKLRAVVVGIERSPDQLAFRGAAASAKAVAAALAKRFAYGGGGDAIALLTDEGGQPVTTTAVLNALHAQSEAARAADAVIFYFAGPAGLGEISQRPVLLASRADNLMGAEIDLTLIRRVVSELSPARFKLIVIDSGRQSNVGAPGAWSRASGAAAVDGADPFSKAVTHEGSPPWSGSKVAIVLSSSAGQWSWIETKPGAMGVLSRCFVAGLDSAAGQKPGRDMTLDGFMRELRTCVPKASVAIHSARTIQTPFTVGLEKQEQLIVARGTRTTVADLELHITGLDINVTPADAEVFVDGVRVANGAGTLPAMPGYHELEASAGCHDSRKVSFTLADGETKPVKLVLPPLQQRTAQIHFENATPGLVVKLADKTLPLRGGRAEVPACEAISLQVIQPGKPPRDLVPLTLADDSEWTIDLNEGTAQP